MVQLVRNVSRPSKQLDALKPPSRETPVHVALATIPLAGKRDPSLEDSIFQCGRQEENVTLSATARPVHTGHPSSSARPAGAPAGPLTSGRRAAAAPTPAGPPRRSRQSISS